MSGEESLRIHNSEETFRKGILVCPDNYTAHKRAVEAEARR